LTAGQGIVTHYAETAVEVFLPQLEKGLSDENWRIRYSSIQLLGDLLYHISGVTGKMSTVSEEDDNFGTEYSTQALIQTLGLERRNRVLSGLYMSRSDEAVLVRQTALHVWKIVVANTARTLRDILQDLLKMLLLSLATESDERRQVAARTLGDIVRKLGERVLPDIIPILENGLLSESSVERQGVCVGLSEIMASTTKDYVQAYQDSLIPTIRRALCDPLPEVRVAAAMTFDTLHSNIGPKALEDILPSLLNILKNGSGDEVDFALDGLKQVMTVKSRVVMPFLVPKLTSPPINAKALALLSAVAGDALTRHLITILPALLRSLSTMAADSDCNEELEASKTLVLSVSSEVGVRCVMDELIAARKNPNPGIRKASVVLLQAFCSETRTDYSQHVPRLLIELIQLFGDDEHSVVTAAWDALNAVIEKLPAADQLACIVHVRQGIKFVKSEFEGDLPGFCLPKKGIKPLLQILREGVLNGSPEQKEQAASGLGDVITLTSAEALKQHVVQITGPLIRILGDRFSWNVKVAILETLSLVIVKSGVTAKAFVPQLQTTFVKALNDANQIVRLRAAFALEKLVVLQNRVDPLFNDLSTGIKSNEEPGIKQTLLLALQGALRSGGSRMSEGVRHTMTGFLSGLLQAPDDTVQKAAAGCVGALCVILPDNELSQLVTEHFLDDRVSDEWNVRYGRSLAMREAFVSAFDRILTADNRDRWLDTVVSHTSSDRVSLCTAGLACVEALLSSELNDVKEVLLPCIVKCLLHSSNDVRVATSATVKQVAKTSRFSIEDLQQLVPPLIESTSEKNSPVRLSAEQALVSILELRKNSDRLQECLAAFDNSIANSLLACYKKTLSKCAAKKDDNTEADEL
jgi:HEAT repeat protein